MRKGRVSATITFEKEPSLSYKKILGNVGSIRHVRSTITIKDTSGKLIVSITASDVTALRASINSVLRDLQVVGATTRLKT